MYESVATVVKRIDERKKAEKKAAEERSKMRENAKAARDAERKKREEYRSKMREDAKAAIAEGKCWKCKGSGVITCNRCRGTGKYGGRGDRCRTCVLGVIGPCHACRGTGELTQCSQSPCVNAS